MKVMTVVVAPVSRVSVSEAKAFLAKVAAAMVQKMVDKAAARVAVLSFCEIGIYDGTLS